MGKATINSHLGDGQYSITTVFDKARAQAEQAKLEAVLAKVQERIDADPAPDAVTMRVLLIRKTALEKQIERITSAAEMSRTVSVWCPDLIDDLSGTVGTIEVETDPVYGGLMLQPGYAGNAAYDADRDGIETPFRTMNVADAILNFALMPAIQKWEPTYRYGTISNLDQEAGTCDLALENANSYIQAININLWTYYSAVPIEYMNCDGGAFSNGDNVIAQFDPYDVTGTIKVIGFKDNPRPCESRHILIETTGSWLLYDIVQRRVAHDLGDGAPTFPCAKNTTTNAWIAANVTDDADDTLYASITDTVDNDYVDPNRTFGPVTEWWFYHQDNALATTLFLGGVGCNVAGWGTSQGSAVCIDGSSDDTYTNAYLSTFPAHTGGTIESVWGAEPNWGLWAPECCKFEPDPPTIPSNFVFYNSYREWFIVAPLDDSYVSKIVSSNGSEDDRSFLVCSEGWGETTFNYQAYAFEEHYVEFELTFFSPFEDDAVSTSIEFWDYPANSVSGLEMGQFSTQVQTKHNNQDMVGVCTFAWKIHDKSGGADQVGDDSPHADWYVSTDIDDQNIPNPWGSHLQRDDNLSTIFATMINSLNSGTLAGFTYRFVDVTISED